MTLYDDIPTRLNGQDILASWFNILKTAGQNSGWKKYTFTHTQFQTAALTNTLECFSLAAYETLDTVLIKHNTAFAGTGITAYTIQVGITGTLDKYGGPFDVFQAIGDTVKEINTVTDIESFSGSTSIKITAISSGANLDQSTAGSVDVWVKKSLVPSA